ncbi:MAG: hypothetical protein ABGU93_01105 [Acetobacterium sp.]|uniref:hypothetical protein n=1 Tax=Acetobacterium sp. TaxID=1872094 RepID=UPI003241E237
MKIVAIQMKVALKQLEENYRRAELWIRKAAAAGADPEEQLIFAEVDLAELDKARNNMTIFKDRRSELY